MSARRPTPPTTTVEKAVRWGGLAALLVAVGLGVAQVPNTRPWMILLLVVAVGCYIAMAVLGRQRKTGQEPSTPGNG